MAKIDMNKSARSTLTVAHFIKETALGRLVAGEGVVSLHVQRNSCKLPASPFGSERRPDLLFPAMNPEFTLIFYMLQEAPAHPRGAAHRHAEARCSPLPAP